MAGKCVNNGAKPKWTDDEMLAALKRVQTMTQFVGVSEYRILRLPTEPSSEAITGRFRSWNNAKIKAGLAIRLKTVLVRDGERLQDDEEEMPVAKRTKYPCWKCHRPFMGMGRRKGNWHCEECTEQNNVQAAGMGW